MIITHYETKQDWLDDRPGRITGTGLNDVITQRGNGTKVGVYQLIADRLLMDDGSVDGRDRGTELEPEAVAAIGAELELELETDLVMWKRDDNENVAFSPDGYTADLTIAIEAKCLSSGYHIEAILTNKIPSKHRTEYEMQRLQAFIVNDDLQIHYLGFYDPRITAKPLFIIKTTREDLADDIEFYKTKQIELLKWVDQQVEKLSF